MKALLVTSLVLIFLFCSFTRRHTITVESNGKAYEVSLTSLYISETILTEFGGAIEIGTPSIGSFVSITCVRSKYQSYWKLGECGRSQSTDECKTGKVIAIK